MIYGRFKTRWCSKVQNELGACNLNLVVICQLFEMVVYCIFDGHGDQTAIHPRVDSTNTGLVSEIWLIDKITMLD